MCIIKIDTIYGAYLWFGIAEKWTKICYISSPFLCISKIAGSKSRASHNLLLASQTSTPRITPPGSPPSMSALVSPTRTSSKPVSPRRHAISFSTSRGMFDDRSSVGSQTGETSFRSLLLLHFYLPDFYWHFFITMAHSLVLILLSQDEHAWMEKSFFAKLGEVARFNK